MIDKSEWPSWGELTEASRTRAIGLHKSGVSLLKLSKPDRMIVSIYRSHIDPRRDYVPNEKQATSASQGRSLTSVDDDVDAYGTYGAGVRGLEDNR